MIRRQYVWGLLDVGLLPSALPRLSCGLVQMFRTVVEDFETDPAVSLEAAAEATGGTIPSRPARNTSPGRTYGGILDFSFGG